MGRFAQRKRIEEDPILALVGSGKHLWGDEDPDEYVRGLREGWDESYLLDTNLFYYLFEDYKDLSKRTIGIRRRMTSVAINF